MTDAPNLFDQRYDEQIAQAVTEKAIRKVGLNADEEWRQEALDALYLVCIQRSYFTTDDVHRILDQQDVTTHEPRALGAIMRSPSAKRWCYATENYQPSKRVDCHRRPVRVWRSRLHSGPVDVVVTGDRL